MDKPSWLSLFSSSAAFVAGPVEYVGERRASGDSPWGARRSEELVHTSTGRDRNAECKAQAAAGFFPSMHANSCWRARFSASAASKSLTAWAAALRPWKLTPGAR